MSELRDYQRVFVDNIIDDMGDAIHDEYPNASLESIGERFRVMLESRIESYDRERKEQIERDLPGIVACAVSEYIL